jgi:hypothetical protein
MWIAFVRIFFLFCMSVAFAISFVVMGFSANFSETDPACVPQGGCTSRILIAALMLCAPTMAVLALGWWRAEATNAEGGRDKLRLFRLYTGSVAPICYFFTRETSGASLLPAMLAPAGVAMIVSWLVVEASHASARQ